MSLRARSFHLLLALGIVLLQQAAILHGILHLEDLAQQLVANRTAVAWLTSGQPDTDTLCIECLAFVQVGTAAPGAAIDIALPPAPHPESRVPAQPRVGSAPNVPFFARAPPTVS